MRRRLVPRAACTPLKPVGRVRMCRRLIPRAACTPLKPVGRLRMRRRLVPRGCLHTLARRRSWWRRCDRSWGSSARCTQRRSAGWARRARARRAARRVACSR
eukprot:2120869-Prymnesium_polylepis.1